MKRDEAGRFIERLASYKQKEDRAALAALRRGVGKPPGTEAAMFPHMPWVPKRIDSPEYKAAFIVASLFPLHPSVSDNGTMGSVMERVKKAKESESIEARFVALLQAHPEDLQGRMRGCIQLAKAGEIPINWTQLLLDLQGLLTGGDWAEGVKRRWAQDFWAPRSTSDSNDTPDNEETIK